MGNPWVQLSKITGSGNTLQSTKNRLTQYERQREKTLPPHTAHHTVRYLENNFFLA
jgi:hypothetical protein